MKKKLRKAEDVIQEYNEKYGDIPSNTEDILSYLQNKFTRLDMGKVYEKAKEIDAIPWEKEEHLIPVIPKPASRPRYSFETSHFYVPGSDTNKKIMKKILQISDNLIMSRTKVHMDFYIPTPCYKMTQMEIYLAEMKKICPLIDPDVDNMVKAYLDAVKDVILADDNIVTTIVGNKYFSVKPRVYLEIEYQTRFDSSYNEKIIMARLK